MQKPQVNSTSTMLPIIQKMQDTPASEIQKKHFGEASQLALRAGLCPYCDTDEVEGFLFGGSDHREGGVLDCAFCRVRIAWIDNPFEAEEHWYEN